MKFKNDEQRKAVFANIGSLSVHKTKVNSSSVKNFEIGISKNKPKQKNITSKSLQRSKNPSLNNNIKTIGLNYSTHLEDIKTKGTREFCNMCKQKGLSLTKGACSVCTKEKEEFDKHEGKRMKEEYDRERKKQLERERRHRERNIRENKQRRKYMKELNKLDVTTVEVPKKEIEDFFDDLDNFIDQTTWEGHEDLTDEDAEEAYQDFANEKKQLREEMDDERKNLLNSHDKKSKKEFLEDFKKFLIDSTEDNWEGWKTSEIEMVIDFHPNLKKLAQYYTLKNRNRIEIFSMFWPHENVGQWPPPGWIIT